MGSVPDVIQQAAAIPIHQGRVCLVTSRGGKGWVVPKGCLERRKTRRQTALQEAWEEAGLLGVLRPDPVGTYCYEKSGRLCHVTVFWMQVTEVMGDWPECAWRRRRWCRPGKALERIREPGLSKLLRRVLGESADLPA